MVDINKVLASDKPSLDPERLERAAEVAEWTPERLAGAARDEGIELTDQHREVIALLQEEYILNGPARHAREIARFLERHFSRQGGRKFLFELFPGGPVAQGCRVAGLPKPHDAEDGSFGSVF